jgi:hypothetical protein
MLDSWVMFHWGTHEVSGQSSDCNESKCGDDLEELHCEVKDLKERRNGNHKGSQSTLKMGDAMKRKKKNCRPTSALYIIFISLMS